MQPELCRSTLYAVSCFAGGSLHLRYYAANFMPGVESAQLPQALCEIDGTSHQPSIVKLRTGQ
eukprot:scaffold177517_cov20-Prasinocladus_malaysianus.AAC.2